MARSSARRSPPRADQLALIDLGCESAVHGHDALGLSEQIAVLEQEVRYYRRVLPALSRAAAVAQRQHRAETGASPQLVRWLTDGQRLIGSLSQTFEEQRQLEVRLQALERGHRQVREELAELFAEETGAPDTRPSLFGTAWFRAGLAVLLLAIVLVASVPYVIDWWHADNPPPSSAPSELASPRHG